MQQQRIHMACVSRTAFCMVLGDILRENPFWMAVSLSNLCWICLMFLISISVLKICEMYVTYNILQPTIVWWRCCQGVLTFNHNIQHSKASSARWGKLWAIMRQTMGYHNPNKWGGVSPNKLTSQPDILLMAQVPPNNTQQCSAAHFGRQSSILSWRRVWHGQHARFCFFSTVLPCWLWKADCEQKSHIQHFKVGTTTIWFDNNHDIKNTKKKSVGQCWVTVHCSLGAAPAFVVALPDAEQLTSPGGQLCSRSTSEEKDDKSHGII